MSGGLWESLKGQEDCPCRFYACAKIGKKEAFVSGMSISTRHIEARVNRRDVPLRKRSTHGDSATSYRMSIGRTPSARSTALLAKAIAGQSGR